MVVMLMVVGVVVGGCSSYDNVPIGSQSDLPNYTVIAKKRICREHEYIVCTSSHTA